MKRFLILTLVFALGMSAAYTQAASDPSETVRQSEQVLGDLMAIPARQIPQQLLAEAQGVAIIPNVLKIGFVAGARRGHGVVMVRDAEGEWSLPQFVVLTGGSLGWQAGIQGTDVVLVFTARKGVEGLMKGKFTIGADASVSAGPLGRNAAAATDAALKSEILSYSRSRGLFAGVSIDGSAIEIDHDAHFAFYGSPTAEVPRHVPESAAQLRHYLVELTQGGAATAKEGERPPAKIPAQRLETLRRSLVQSAGQLHAILSPEWRQYLAFPREIMEPVAQPNVEALIALQQRFAKIDSSPNYKQLSQRPEFQATHELLREYVETLSATRSTLQLPPPPAK
jgi:lipid-binding SYLF domain-containing protein